MTDGLTLPARLPRFGRGIVTLTVKLGQWQNRQRSRKALMQLDNHLLNDIGLDPASAATECTKPFWRD